MAAKVEQLQVRVTTREKAAIRAAARRAGLGLSEFVLARVLPPAGGRFAELLRALSGDGDHRFALAGLNDLLSSLSPVELESALADADLAGLSPYLQNYVAAMVEQACVRQGLTPPAWVGRVEPLEHPHFVVPFASLRPHLLGAAPVAFKRRNIFVDASIGDRV